MDVLSPLSPQDQPARPDVLSPPPAPPAAPVTRRKIGDIPATRKQIYANVLASARQLKPIANSRHTLSLRDVDYEGPEDFPVSHQKQVLLSQGSLSRKLRGTWTLTDNATGKVLDEKRATLANVPHMSQRGTFIINGSEYALSSQMRLRPGVYARRKGDGTIESHLNVKQGKGPSHRIFLDPETGVFKANINQANIPLIPLLRVLGVTDSELVRHWGAKIASVNKKHDSDHHLEKLYARLVRKADLNAPDVDRRTALANALKAMELDPEVTKHTLGYPHASLSKEAYLATTKKLLALNRGEAEPDDRDHLAFQNIMGPEELLAERIGKDKAGLHKLLWQASFRGNLQNVQPGTFNKAIMAGFMGSGLGTQPEGTNAAEFVDHAGRITRLGEGGIGSAESIPDSARTVHPSQFGFVDPIRSPESSSIGVDMRLAYGVQKGSDGRIYAPFRDIKSGQMVYRSPQQIASSTVAFPGELDTGKRWVAAIDHGQMKYVRREKVDVEAPSMENAFSPLSNLLPLKSASKGQRISMGSRMITQALPLVAPEAPHVRAAVPGQPGTSFTSLYGRYMGAVHAEQPGVVDKVDQDSISVKQADGTSKTYELYSHFPGARKTAIHSTPLIKPGDRVASGQIMAKSNYTTDKGEAALGVNARIAYVPFRSVYEDSALISESFAKKLTSEHYYQHKADFDDAVKQGKRAYTALFPGKYDKKTLANLDDNGVVKVGATVNFGDPLVLMAKEREMDHGKITQSRKAAFADQSMTWEHHTPGTVTDVVPGKDGVNVVIKTIAPMQVGDKLAGGYGSKSTVSEIVPDHQMPHDSEGKPFDMAWSPTAMISRTNSSWAIEGALGKVAAKTGQHYTIEDFGKNPNLTEYALKEMEKYGVPDTETVTDPATGRQIPNVLTGVNYIMKLHHTSECFDDQTEALTARGWVLWPEVRDDDLLATLDDGRLLFEKPKSVIRQQFDGYLFCFSGRYVDYAVTGNHRMYVRKPYSDQPFYFEKARNLHGRRFCVMQFGLKPDVPVESPTIRIGDHELPWDDYAELVGWWASEGYAKATKRSASVLIYQSRSANPDKFERIEALMRRLPFRWHYYKSRGEDYGVGISSRPLAEHLKSFGTHSHNKRLPRHIIEGPVSGRERALSSLMAGDGAVTWTPTGYSARYTTTSVGLADDFQELCVRSGSGAVVRSLPARGPAHHRRVWECGLALERTVAQVDGDRNGDSFSVRRYAGVVYCAEMRTGLLYVRRNGKPMVSGNSKSQGRGLGSYSSEGAPVKGSAGGAKRLSLGDSWQLLSHGSLGILRDSRETRSQKNDEFWMAYMGGFPTPPAKVPFVYEKFLHELKGAGINVVREGPRLRLMAMTDKDVNTLASNRELRNAETVRFDKGLEPVPGGLFSPELTGGHGGNNWARITLAEPLPNPAFADPIKKLLGLTEKQFLGVLSGKEELQGNTGPAAISKALDAINVPKSIEEARKAIASGRKTARDDAVRRLSYLKALERTGQHPSDWMLKAVPVLPPVFRPVSVLAGGRSQMVSDPNLLYRELFDANENLKSMKGRVADLGEERLALYKSFEGVVGLGDPTHPKNVERGVKGILRNIFGSSPKFSVVQTKLLGTTVDLAGRAVITPDPDMDMDHVGLPEDKCFEVFKPFVVRHLVRNGVPRVQAVQEVEDRSKMARNALETVSQERPVLLNRYPLLHRYGLMAFWAKPIRGDAIRLPPLVYKGFGADNDGDAMQWHVPVADYAVKDAVEKMLPSKNLFSAATFKAHYLPTTEYQQGLHAASTMKEDRPAKVYRTRADAMAAYRRGEIGLGQPVEIIDHA